MNFTQDKCKHNSVKANIGRSTLNYSEELLLLFVGHICCSITAQFLSRNYATSLLICEPNCFLLHFASMCFSFSLFSCVKNTNSSKLWLLQNFYTFRKIHQWAVFAGAATSVYKQTIPNLSWTKSRRSVTSVASCGGRDGRSGRKLDNKRYI